MDPRSHDQWLDGAVEGQSEGLVGLAMPQACVVTELSRLRSRGGGLDFVRGAMLVGCANERRLMAAQAQTAGVSVVGPEQANGVSKALRAVEVGQRNGDQLLALGAASAWMHRKCVHGKSTPREAGRALFGHHALKAHPP